MKRFTNVFFAMLLLVGVAVQAEAQPFEFIVTAEVPSTESLSFATSRWADANADGVAEFLSAEGANTNLAFGELTLNSSLGIFLPSFFWGIDVGGNAAGLPDITLTYDDQENPNGSGPGLAEKGVITVFKVSGGPAPEDQVTEEIRAPRILGDLPLNLDGSTDLAGGFMRVFLGVSDGSPSAPANSEPFTAADQPGTYGGTLTLTAVFDN